jgi:hypothetical protein
MKPEVSLPLSHGPNAYPHPEPPIYPFMVRSSNCPFSFKFPHQELHVLPPPPQYVHMPAHLLLVFVSIRKAKGEKGATW